jgi:hypothetical protein
LDVAGDIRATSDVIISDQGKKLYISRSDFGPPTSDANFRIVMGPWHGGNTWDYGLGVDGGTLWYTAWDYHRWYTSDGTNHQLRMELSDSRLYVSGNVGIGTTSPGEKLEVSGNIKLTGNYINLAGSFIRKTGSTIVISDV